MSTAQLTVQYINERPYIKKSLQSGLINYSALARVIAKEQGIENKSSIEAILVAARRHQLKLKTNADKDASVHSILVESEIEVKNKIEVFIVPKTVDFTLLADTQKFVRQNDGLTYVLEGSDHFTLIFQKKHVESFRKICPVIEVHHTDLVLVRLKSPDRIEETQGVIAYLCSLFSENGVNMYEMFSCWKDSLFLVKRNDIDKVLSFLQF